MNLELKRKMEKTYPETRVVSKTDLDKPQVPYFFGRDDLVVCPNCNHPMLYKEEICRSCGQHVIYQGHPDFDKVWAEQDAIDKKYEWGKYDPERQRPKKPLFD